MNSFLQYPLISYKILGQFKHDSFSHSRELKYHKNQKLRNFILGVYKIDFNYSVWYIQRKTLSSLYFDFKECQN